MLPCLAWLTTALALLLAHDVPGSRGCPPSLAWPSPFVSPLLRLSNHTHTHTHAPMVAVQLLRLTSPHPRPPTLFRQAQGLLLPQQRPGRPACQQRCVARLCHHGRPASPRRAMHPLTAPSNNHARRQSTQRQTCASMSSRPTGCRSTPARTYTRRYAKGAPPVASPFQHHPPTNNSTRAAIWPQQYATRINKEGELVVTSSKTRSQQRNLEDAKRRLLEVGFPNPSHPRADGTVLAPSQFSSSHSPAASFSQMCVMASEVPEGPSEEQRARVKQLYVFQPAVPSRSSAPLISP